MKKLILALVISATTFIGYGQITVFNNNNVGIGNFYSYTPVHAFDVIGATYLRCNPATFGFYFENYHNLQGSTWFDEAIIRPQFGNGAWLGSPTSPFWRVYSNQVWAHNGTGFVQLSDKRLKSNIRALEPQLDKILLLAPVKYDLHIPKAEGVSDEKQATIDNIGKDNIGFVAQDLQQVFPEAVVYDKENDRYGVAYVALIPILIKAIQEQQAQIDLLRSQIQSK